MSSASLATSRLHKATPIVQFQLNQHGPVTLASPAMSVFTDLSQVRAATVQAHTTLDQAELKMIYLGVRLLFVVSDMPSVDGVLTFVDIAGERPTLLVQQRKMKRHELTAGDLMTPVTEIDTVPLAALRRATVAQVVETLVQHGQPHLLVVETSPEDGSTCIRGLISQAQVERQLGQTLPRHDRAQTFAQLEQVLASH
jgi:CBS domain-containing protein